MPVFLPSIPQPTDQLSVSQGNILNNFTILGAIAGNINASSSSINATSGFNWLFLPTQAGSIPPTGSAFPANNVGLYSATNPGSTKNELYVNRTNPSGTVIQIPITAYNSGAVVGNAATAWTYLPSGMLMISCKATTSGGTITITFNAGPSGLASFPGFSSFITNISLIRIDNSGSSTTVMRVRTFSLTQLVVGLADGSTDSTFFWSVTGL